MVLYLTWYSLQWSTRPVPARLSLVYSSAVSIRSRTKYQTIGHWNLVPHTSHVGSNSSKGRENMLAPNHQKVFAVWDSSNIIFKLRLGLISVNNYLRDLCQINQIPWECLCLVGSGGILREDVTPQWVEYTVVLSTHADAVGRDTQTPAPETFPFTLSQRYWAPKCEGVSLPPSPR